MKVAVLSDIHAAAPDAKGVVGSYTSSSPNVGAASRDAMLSLEQLIQTEKLNADYVVCCGDLANQANPPAMQYAWTKFFQIAKLLKAEPLATVGNHDLDSRLPATKFDARGLVRGLTPPFPIGEKSKTYEFWSRNFALVHHKGIRFVVLNSCAFHGFNPEGSEKEYLHGRISEFTLDDLRAELAGLPASRDISILICHHHPHRHYGDSEADQSAMIGGERLIDMLGKVCSNTWLVLHGHRHQPRLTHWGGNGRGPIIFGAGSFSAKLGGELGSTARNQFYLLEFDPSEALSLNLDVAGEFRAWDFSNGEGWVSAGKSSGLPARGGFGYQINAKADASAIAVFVDGSSGIARWDAVLAADRKLRFATPDSLGTLERELRDHHSIGCTWSANGTPFEFARFPK